MEGSLPYFPLACFAAALAAGHPGRITLADLSTVACTYLRDVATDATSCQLSAIRFQALWVGPLKSRQSSLRAPDG
jgi:hypothetical protein